MNYVDTIHLKTDDQHQRIFSRVICLTLYIIRSVYIVTSCSLKVTLSAELPAVLRFALACSNFLPPRKCGVGHTILPGHLLRTRPIHAFNTTRAIYSSPTMDPTMDFAIDDALEKDTRDSSLPKEESSNDNVVDRVRDIIYRNCKRSQSSLLRSLFPPKRSALDIHGKEDPRLLNKY
ncbi:uncharacterized protein LOC115241018, partial [Formica exsecta]|uniref:uncharacterized protein LOC115241018 n=1 Tax=Formica exsecta TaxID=72781 RepID=UPI001144FC92